jgi:hypothetical protein
MSLPTTCSECGHTFPIGAMIRDREGYWFCPNCEKTRVACALDAIEKLRAEIRKEKANGS